MIMKPKHIILFLGIIEKHIIISDQSNDNLFAYLEALGLVRNKNPNNNKCMTPDECDDDCACDEYIWGEITYKGDVYAKGLQSLEVFTTFKCRLPVEEA